MMTYSIYLRNNDKDTLTFCVNVIGHLLLNASLIQVLLDSLSIHTYDASLEEEMIVEVHVDEKLASVVKAPYKLEILVENMGRTNIGWNLKKLRKGEPSIVVRTVESRFLKFPNNLNKLSFPEEF